MRFRLTLVIAPPTLHACEAACTQLGDDAGNALKIPSAPDSTLQFDWQTMVTATQIYATAGVISRYGSLCVPT